MADATNASSSAGPPGEGRLARERWSSSSKSGSSTHTGWCSPSGTRMRPLAQRGHQVQPLGDDPADLGVPRGGREERAGALGRVEHHDRPHVQRGGRRLEREERGVQPFERLHHRFTLPVPVCAEAAGAPRSASPRPVGRHQGERRFLDPHDDQLGDPVSPAHGVVLHRVVVDQITWSSPR